MAVLVHGYLFRGDGGKMFAGMACCTMYATLALAALSIPRRVDMTFERLIICCLVEITIIDTEDIERAERLPRPPRWSFPVAGVWGVGGYYGYWFDLRRWRLFKLYTADWRGPCFRICRTYACDIIVAAPQEKQSPIKGGVKYNLATQEKDVGAIRRQQQSNLSTAMVTVEYGVHPKF